MSSNDFGQFTDSAFDPQPTFDFDDFHDKTLRDMSKSTTAKSGKPDDAAMYDIRWSEYHSISSYQDMSQGGYRGGIAPSSLQNTNASSKAAAWSDDGQQFREGAMQRFGQITPPDDKQAASPRPDRLGNVTVDKSERARNAANQRHSKKGRQGSKDVAGEQSEEEEGLGGDKKERYREKNRQAAAKCRDKKKKNTDDLDKRYKIVAAENAARKQEVRMLRDEFCRIRELALQHAPEQCACSSLHAFNMQQAVNEASHMARTMGDMAMMDASNNGRYDSDVTSPDSAETSAHAHAFPDSTMAFEYTSGDVEFRC